MVRWINHVAIAAPRAGELENTHTVDPSAGTVITGALFTPAAGNLLVCVCGGSVTSTTPTGWTLPGSGSAINNAAIYIWYRTAAGGDTFTTTHNAADYPVVFDFYEFAAGSTFIGANAQGNVPATGGDVGPSLGGLTASANLRAAAGCQEVAVATGPTYTWSVGTEAVDTAVINAATAGYGYSLAYLEDAATATFSSAQTSTLTSRTIERVVFAVNAAAASSTITGTLSASAPSLTVGPPTASISGTVTVPTYAGDIAASTAALTVGPPTMAMSGTVTPPTYSGTLSADAPAITVGPPTAAISGTVTAPGTNAIDASTPTITIGPPTSSITGTVTPPIYAGAIAAAAPAIVIGPPELAMSGTVAVPVYSGTLVATAPTITVGPPTAQIYDGSIPPLPTTGVSLTVSTGTRGLTVTTEARSLEVST